jgi:hypothetical protein
MITHQQWMMNYQYRQSVQQQQGYDFIIENIRQQNLLMMQKQQEYLLSQITKHGNRLTMDSNTYNN